MHPTVGLPIHDGLAVGSDLVQLPTVEMVSQQPQLVAFLQGKGEPAAGLGIQLQLEGQVHRAVQQGAGGADPEPLAKLILQRF
ncbi:hypothetical protein D3C80_1253520 [compost metagenome]